MSSFGFVHLPSLLVFIRPMPSSSWEEARDAVNRLALGQGDFDDVSSALPAMAENQRQETVLRVTALSHETRHFHDFLLTPYGNQLVRDAFWYSLLTFGALTELSEKSQDDRRLKVPLPVDPGMLPIYGERLMAMKASFRHRATQGLGLMEGAAIYVQLRQAEIDLGPLAAESLSAVLRQMRSHYRKTLDELWRFQGQLGIDDHDFGPIALGLTLNCLLDPAPMAVNKLTGPMAPRAAPLSGRAAAELIQGALAAAIENVVARAMAAAQQANDEFLEKLKRAVPDPFRELVVDPFADFTRAAAALQAQFLEDPSLFLDPDRYLRAGTHDRVQPFVYLLADGSDTMLVEHRRWEELLSDPLTYVREFEVEGRTLYQLTCVPAPFEGKTLDEDAWKNFADALAGSLVIAEGADREHPVEGMWLRKMEKRWPVDFTPFGEHAVWDPTPARAIV